jgi:hypothetical protein
MGLDFVGRQHDGTQIKEQGSWRNCDAVHKPAAGDFNQVARRPAANASAING